MVVGLALLLPAAASAQSAPTGERSKVLVVTSANDSLTRAGIAAIRSAGKVGRFSVTAPNPAGVGEQFTATKLEQYGAVVFLDTGPASPLTDAQRTAFEDYFDRGGGFVGIGSAIETDPGWQFLTEILGTRPDPESSDEETAQDVEFLDRVHPATRDLPALFEGHEDVWYTWATNPTGSVHTVARARFASIPAAGEFTGEVPEYVTETHIIGEGESLTNDAVKDDSGGDDPNSNSNRPVSWCRDIDQGRSFYTGLGRVSSAYESEELEGHLAGAIQWAAGMMRGNCKATINSNYEGTRLTPPNSPGELDMIGEGTHMDIADNGLVFYIGRATSSRSPTGTTPTSASAAARFTSGTRASRAPMSRTPTRSPTSRRWRCSATAAAAPRLARPASPSLG
jgi:hypothetical protein